MLYAFHLQSFCILNFYKRIVRFVPAISLDCTVPRIRQDSCRLMSLCSYRPANPSWIRTDSKHSLRLFDMSFLLVPRLLNSRICLFRTDSSQYRFATFLYPQAYEQSESDLSNSKPLTCCLPLYRGTGSRLRPG